MSVQMCAGAEKRALCLRQCVPEPRTAHYVCASMRRSRELRIMSVPVCSGVENCALCLRQCAPEPRTTCYVWANVRQSKQLQHLQASHRTRIKNDSVLAALVAATGSASTPARTACAGAREEMNATMILYRTDMKALVDGSERNLQKMRTTRIWVRGSWHVCHVIVDCKLVGGFS